MSNHYNPMNNEYFRPVYMKITPINENTSEVPDYNTHKFTCGNIYQFT